MKLWFNEIVLSKAVFALGMIVLLSACSEDSVSCSNGKPIAKEIVIKESAIPEIAKQGIKLEIDLEDVRIISETKFQAECAANVAAQAFHTANGLKTQNKTPITYRVERTEKGQLYVSVSGY